MVSSFNEASQSDFIVCFWNCFCNLVGFHWKFENLSWFFRAHSVQAHAEQLISGYKNLFIFTILYRLLTDLMNRRNSSFIKEWEKLLQLN